jgi:hypothetical protein
VAGNCAICTAIYKAFKIGNHSFWTDTTPFCSRVMFFGQLAFQVRCLDDATNHELLNTLQGSPTSFVFRWCPLPDERPLQRVWFEWAPESTVQSLKASLRAAASFRYPSNTGHPAVAEFVHSWLTKCVNSHTECRGPEDPYYPPRLLELEEDHARIRTDEEMIEEDRRPLKEIRVEERMSRLAGMSQPYATLSHAWGTAPNFLTLTASKS